MREQTTHIDENAIRAKAHELWVQRGCPQNSAQDDWYQAERLLKAQAETRTVAQSPARVQPLSDPPTEPNSDAPARQKESAATGKGSRQR
jgi:hypothetical protein